LAKTAIKQMACGAGAALLLNAASAPVSFWPAGFAAFLPLFWLFEATPGRRFLIGWLCGFLTQALAYYWIFYTIRDFSGQTATISLAGGLLFWLYQGLDIALWLWLAPLLFRPLPRWAQAFGAAGLWLTLQAALFPYVFPWCYGAFFAAEPLIAQSAALWDAHGLGLLAVCLQGMVVLNRTRPKTTGWGTVTVMALWLAGGWFHRPGPTETWRVAAVQPNLIPFAKRGGTTMSELFRAHEAPSRQFLDADLDLLIWPETALSFNLQYYVHFQERARTLALELDAAIVTGAIGVADDGKYFNEIWLIPPDDSPPQIYRKERLVMFSERLPWIFSWAAQFDGAIGGFAAGQDNKAFVYRDKKLVPLVCFEALFSGYVRQRPGHLLINLTNDAWFGPTKASWQHLQQIQLRAVEAQAPLARATNSGVTCWIDRDGRTRDAGGIYDAATFLFEIPVPIEEPPVYNGYGLNLLAALALAALLWSLARRFKQDRETAAPR